MKILLNTINSVKEFHITANKFPYDIYVSQGRYTVDGKSIMGIFSLDVLSPLELSVEDEHIAVAKMIFKKYIIEE